MPLLYLHGFRSSPRSFKAQMLGAWLAANRPDVLWWCPQLPPSPAAAWALIREGTAGWPVDTMLVAGSSLGGFYATALAEATGCRALVMNPAVDPARDLAAHLGTQSSWHDPETRFTFERRHLDELRALAVPAITRPERYAALLAKGDELLDWREMAAHYRGARIRLLEGSDHALSDFADHLPFVLEALGLAPSTPTPPTPPPCV